MKKITILKSGITLISQCFEHTHSVTISVSFRTGPLYENNSNNGITHLVEHMYFRKWDDLLQNELYLEMMMIGAEITGQTYNDYVCFSITVVPEFFISAFELIKKCLNKFYWNESDIAAEKKVVFNQIENYYQSYQDWQNYNYFQGTKYEYPIMGTMESVRNLAAKDINEWKDTFFCCSNSCVTITGNYTEKDFIVVNQKLAEIKNYGKSVDTIICLPKNFSKRNSNNRYIIFPDDSKIADVTIFFDINSKYDYETVRLLCAILGEGCGSVLSMTLRESTGLVDDIYTDLMCFSGFYRLSISFNVKNCNFFECMVCFFETISSFKKCINETEYLKSIAFFTHNQIMDLDSPKTLNNRYVLCDFILKSVLSEPLEMKEKYESILYENLYAYSREILTENNISFLIQTNIKAEKVKKHLEEIIVELLK